MGEPVMVLAAFRPGRAGVPHGLDQSRDLVQQLVVSVCGNGVRVHQAQLAVEKQGRLGADTVTNPVQPDGLDVLHTGDLPQRGVYLVAAAFERAGMSGLLDDKRGRRGPVKLTAEIGEFLQAAPPARSGAELAVEVADRFGVVLHRRTVERARGW